MGRLRLGAADQHGQALVIVAAVLAALLLGVGLAVDVGTVLSARRTAQNATDAAAWGGAVYFYKNSSATPAQVITAACGDAQDNGYTDASCIAGGTAYNATSAPRSCSANTATTVKVYYPPCSGAHIADAKFVEVVIAQPTATIFLRGAAAGGLTAVQARGVAGQVNFGGGPVVLALHPGTYSNAIKVSGLATVNVISGTLVANSTNSKAMSIKYANTVNDPSGVCLVGGVDMATGFTAATPVTQNSAGCHAGDPLLSALNSSTEPTGTATVATCNSTTRICQPGYYASGISINSGTWHLVTGTYQLKGGMSVSGGATVIIDPPSAGGYTTLIIQGGGITVSGTGTALSGTEIFIFNSNDPTTGLSGCQNVDVQASITLSAPTSGPYWGILIWEDADCVKTVKFTGQGTSSMTGVIYAPNGFVSIGSGAGATMTFAGGIVVDHIEIANDGATSIDATGGRLGGPGLIPTLAE